MQLLTSVILYNSAIADSTTLQSILACQLANHDLTLHIWNNGPKALKKSDIDSYTAIAKDKGISVFIHEDLRNLALSKIYNFIINQGEFDFFIPFDQDSILTNDFFITITSHSALDLILPRIETVLGEQIKFPYYVKQGPIMEEGNVIVNRVTSINSGMALSKKLITYFKAESLTVFDERFAFYGIDTAFFLNLWMLYTKYPEISCGCYGKIKHSLAMDEEEESQGKLSDHRKLEYIYFFILYRLHYKHRPKLSVLFHVVNKIRKSKIKNKNNIISLVTCIVQGKHPRSNLSIIEHQN